MSTITFEQAKAQYVHRYTIEHVPQWSQKQADNGKYYAPHYASDEEWFDNTQFYDPSRPNYEQLADKNSCYSSAQTWPLGHWLDEPFKD